MEGSVRRGNRGGSSNRGEAARTHGRAGAASLGLSAASELPGPFHLQCPAFIRLCSSSGTKSLFPFYVNVQGDAHKME